MGKQDHSTSKVPMISLVYSDGDRTTPFRISGWSKSKVKKKWNEIPRADKKTGYFAVLYDENGETSDCISIPKEYAENECEGCVLDVVAEVRAFSDHVRKICPELFVRENEPQIH